MKNIHVRLHILTYACLNRLSSVSVKWVISHFQFPTLFLASDLCFIMSPVFLYFPLEFLNSSTNNPFPDFPIFLIFILSYFSVLLHCFYLLDYLRIFFLEFPSFTVWPSISNTIYSKNSFPDHCKLFIFYFTLRQAKTNHCRLMFPRGRECSAGAKVLSHSNVERSHLRGGTGVL